MPDCGPRNKISMATAASGDDEAEEQVSAGMDDLLVEDKAEEIMVVEDEPEPQGNLGIQGFNSELQLSLGIGLYLFPNCPNPLYIFTHLLSKSHPNPPQTSKPPFSNNFQT